MWNQRYSEPGYAYGTDPNDFLKEQYHRIPAGGKVLCLAEGEGRNAVFLAKQGYRVTAVDLSPIGIKKAHQLAAENGVNIITNAVDLADYDMGRNEWDGIISIFAHTPVPIRRRIHALVPNALRDNGCFILEAYTIEHLQMEGTGGPMAEQKELFMSLSGLKNELAGLRMLLGNNIQRVMDEGRLHRGMSAVVQVVGTRACDSIVPGG
ncbi:MAG: SAM-dependent methyltransferase [Spirochaeta sp. LUC14_002_19_P3]|nr:MAG: SAM-dependent methyltransferase [Spirochaeta sp. LUC14_002_19_P3]